MQHNDNGSSGGNNCTSYASIARPDPSLLEYVKTFVLLPCRYWIGCEADFRCLLAREPDTDRLSNCGTTNNATWKRTNAGSKSKLSSSAPRRWRSVIASVHNSASSATPWCTCTSSFCKRHSKVVGAYSQLTSQAICRRRRQTVLPLPSRSEA